MKKLAYFYLGIAGALLIMYVVALALDLSLLGAPSQYINDSSVGVAAIIEGLLIIDALIPIPSSLIMTTSGALFGFYLGAGLSLAGRVGSFVLGYVVGFRFVRTAEKFVSKKERCNIKSWLTRWGTLAIIITRPVPLLSETTSLTAGVLRYPFSKSLIAAIIGSLPEAALYAFIGAFAGTFVHTGYIFVIVIVLAFGTWLLTYKKNSKIPY